MSRRAVAHLRMVLTRAVAAAHNRLLSQDGTAFLLEDGSHLSY